MKHPDILIIDLGSQYTIVIGRTLRELGFRSVIFSPKRAEEYLNRFRPKSVILSGGSASVYDENSPRISRRVLEMEIPILGICYGMHLIAKMLGGTITVNRENKEYGETFVEFNPSDKLFLDLKGKKRVWVSHGDSVTFLPRGFWNIASSENGTIAAMSNEKKKIWGIQFHPEVTHTEEGKNILFRFATAICGCESDWEPKNIIREIRNEVLEATALKRRCIIGFSGGVDSSTLTAILSSLPETDILAVCIDTGALRENELEEIKRNAQAVHAQLRIIKAARRFQKAIGNTVHSEVKRKRFKKLYGRILEEAAKDFDAYCIIQGSLATDIIESGGVGESALIKSHHNVGLNLSIKELHPFRNLFKYETRDLARALDLPQSISERQPFPGPGLFIRILGTKVTSDKLSLVRWADAEVTRILKKHNLYREISQLVVALNGNKIVGIKGDGRSYNYPIVVRAVKTSDFMTAAGYQIPNDVRAEISSYISKHPKIVDVWYAEGNKPPATTEFE